MKSTYYNDNDPYCAQWLRNLIAAGHLPAGEVDERPIQAVRGDDLGRFGQCHFFAGIGGWPLALRLAGWPDDHDVWTGSCPCQPFSAAGKRQGTADARHLWPEFVRLIGQCRPAKLFGEQVASKDGRLWLAGVRADLEALGYAVGASDLCAAGVGSPHIRQRLYWLADADGGNEGDRYVQRGRQHGQQPQDGCAVRMEHTEARGFGVDRSAPRDGGHTDEHGAVGRLVDADEPRPQGRGLRPEDNAGQFAAWASGFDIIGCADGKSRRIESGTFPLAHGIPNRVGRLRGYGNAIVPQVAAEFVSAYMECRP